MSLYQVYAQRIQEYMPPEEYTMRQICMALYVQIIDQLKADGKKPSTAELTLSLYNVELPPLKECRKNSVYNFVEKYRTELKKKEKQSWQANPVSLLQAELDASNRELDKTRAERDASNRQLKECRYENEQLAAQLAIVTADLKTCEEKKLETPKQMARQRKKETVPVHIDAPIRTTRRGRARDTQDTDEGNLQLISAAGNKNGHLTF